MADGNPSIPDPYPLENCPVKLEKLFNFSVSPFNTTVGFLHFL